jgi:hypothetical protein
VPTSDTSGEPFTDGASVSGDTPIFGSTRMKGLRSSRVRSLAGMLGLDPPTEAVDDEDAAALDPGLAPSDTTGTTTRPDKAASNGHVDTGTDRAVPHLSPDIAEPTEEELAAAGVFPATRPPRPPQPPRARRQRQVKAVVPTRPRRPRVRRVQRVVRSVDTWTVFKVSVLFYLSLYVIFLVAGVLLWRVAYETNTIANLEHFFENFGWSEFKFKGGEIFHSAWIIGLFLVVAGVGLNVTLATLFNLITDLVGGVRVSVLEEEVLVRRPRRLEIDRPVPAAVSVPEPEVEAEVEADPPTEPLYVTGNGDASGPIGPVRSGTPANGIPRRVSANGDHSNGTPRPAPQPATWTSPASKID